MVFEILTIEHCTNPELLTSPAEIVTFPLSVEMQEFIQILKDKLIKIQGVGLAAPQIGMAKQIIAIHISEDAQAIRQDGYESIPLTVLINPSYTQAIDATMVYDWEGCFSVAETTGKVPRYSNITYTAQDETGKVIQKEARGFTARVLQHEIDHIQGKLITDRLTPNCLQGHPKEMRSLRLQELTPKQKEIVEKILAKQAKNEK